MAARSSEPLAQAAFLETAEYWLDSADTRRLAAFLDDLWKLFEPSKDDFPAYYDMLSLSSTIRFIDYAGDQALIEEHYRRPYRIAGDRLRTLSVCEVGGGISHGLIRTQLEQPGTLASAAFNDIDAPYTRFSIWFCERAQIPVEWIPATAGGATQLPRDRFNFVIAKDVFEHVHDPEVMLDEIAASATADAILALDLDDKHPGYQHISPKLAHLTDRLEGWRAFGRTGHLTLFERATSAGR